MNTDDINTIINYVIYDSLQLSKEDFHLLNNFPLNDDTLLSVIIPVYNEGGDHIYSNISRTIDFLTNQKDTNGNFIYSYELIIVNNNSSDNSLEIIEYLSKSSSISIIVIEEKQLGYEFALKKGLDFAIRRFLEREIKHGSLMTGKIKFMKYCLASVDADSTDISQLWVYRIIELIENEDISCFGGSMPMSQADMLKYPHINILLNKYDYFKSIFWHFFGGQTPGANMGIKPFWYCRIGGLKRVFNLPYAMDVFMGNKIVSLGGKISMLPKDAYVCFNLRRLLDDPVLWFSGNAYINGVTPIREKFFQCDLQEEILNKLWELRENNLIELLMQLFLLNPSVFFSREQDVLSLFDNEYEYSDFKKTVINSINFQLEESKKILTSKFGSTIKKNVYKYIAKNINNSNILYITIGLPGAGKSSWAKFMESSNSNIRIVSSDDFRREFKDSKDDHVFIFNKMNELLNYYKYNDFDIIYDSTNLNKSYRRLIYSKYKLFYFVIAVVFPMTIEESLEYNSTRIPSKKTNELLIKSLHSEFSEPIIGVDCDKIIEHKRNV